MAVRSLSLMETSLVEMPPFDAAVRRFAAAHGVTHHLSTSRRLAEKHFRYVREITAEVTRDPEIDDESVSLRVVYGGTAADLVDDCKSYMDEFVRTVPAWASELIHLSYRIVST